MFSEYCDDNDWDFDYCTPHCTNCGNGDQSGMVYRETLCDECAEAHCTEPHCTSDDPYNTVNTADGLSCIKCLAAFIRKTGTVHHLTELDCAELIEKLVDAKLCPEFRLSYINQNSHQEAA
jgi:hypothetical protein